MAELYEINMPKRVNLANTVASSIFEGSLGNMVGLNAGGQNLDLSSVLVAPPAVLWKL